MGTSSGVSEKAIEAVQENVSPAAAAWLINQAEAFMLDPEGAEEAGNALASFVDSLVARGVAAAHNPALGLDRSVCLRDVVEAVRRGDRSRGLHGWPSASDFLLREFAPSSEQAAEDGGNADGETALDAAMARLEKTGELSGEDLAELGERLREEPE